MDQDGAGVRKRKRGGEKKHDKAVAVAAVVEKVAECVQQEEAEEDYEGITEESIAEVMGWLELEIKLASSAGSGTAAAATGASSPVPAAAVVGYVTVNGDMESCGPSFSGAASTVMASVDVRVGAPPPPAVPWPLPDAAAAATADEEAVDDEWVDELLTDGPTEDGHYNRQ